MSIYFDWFGLSTYFDLGTELCPTQWSPYFAHILQGLNIQIIIHKSLFYWGVALTTPVISTILKLHMSNYFSHSNHFKSI